MKPNFSNPISQMTVLVRCVHRHWYSDIHFLTNIQMVEIFCYFGIRIIRKVPKFAYASVRFIRRVEVFGHPSSRVNRKALKFDYSDI